MTPHMHVYVLASGSKGNAAVIDGPEGAVLLDCGISRRALHQRAEEVGCDLARVQAILVTHEHTDHTTGLRVVRKHFDGPIYATAGTARSKQALQALSFNLISHDAELELCGMRVQAFPTSHDVNDPMCFRFEVRGTNEKGDNKLLDAIGWVSDTGYLSEQALDALYGCRILGIEANHDPRMLATGPYPYYLKARIASDSGHLSNEQAAEALPMLVTRNTETVVALHISQENNKPSLAIRALTEALGTEAENVTVCAAAQDRPMVVW